MLFVECLLGEDTGLTHGAFSASTRTISSPGGPPGRQPCLLQDRTGLVALGAVGSEEASLSHGEEARRHPGGAGEPDHR